MMKKKGFLMILAVVFVASVCMGCLEDSRDNLEIGKEYEIINAQFISDHEQIKMTYVINNTFNDVQVAFVENDESTSKYQATGVYISDNISYFKLLRNTKTDVDFWNSHSRYFFEIHITDEDLNKFLD